MNRRMLQRGSHHAILAIVMVVGLVGVLGFVGFNSWKKQSAGAADSSILGRESTASTIPLVDSVNYEEYNFATVDSLGLCKNPAGVITSGNVNAVLRTSVPDLSIQLYFDRYFSTASQASIDADAGFTPNSSTGYQYSEFYLPPTVNEIMVYKSVGYDKTLLGQIGAAGLPSCNQKIVSCTITAAANPIVGKDNTYTVTFGATDANSLKNYKFWLQPQDANYSSLGVAATEHAVQLTEGTDNKFTFTYKVPTPLKGGPFTTLAVGVSTGLVGPAPCQTSFPVQAAPVTVVTAPCTISVLPSPKVGTSSEYKFTFGTVTAETVKEYTATVAGVRSDGSRQTLVSSNGLLYAGRINTKSMKTNPLDRVTNKPFLTMEAKVVSGGKTSCVKQYSVSGLSTAR